MRNPWVQILWKTSLIMKELKDKKNKLKRHDCSCIFTLNLLLFILSLGLSVVQMVSYFKTSQSIRVTAPLGRHFKSELQWNVQNQRHVKRTIDTFICSGEKLNSLLASLSGHFTSNMSQNVHGAMYFTSCEKVPTGAFLSWDQVEHNSLMNLVWMSWLYLICCRSGQM